MSQQDEFVIWNRTGQVVARMVIPGLTLPEGARLVYEREPVLTPARPESDSGMTATVRKDGNEKTVIWCTHRFIGMHSWPNATPERAYLASPHRHLFHVKVEVDVEHDDREIEFHDLLDVVMNHCRVYESAGAMSCEMMARELQRAVLNRWAGRMVAAEISEDGEFGARVLPSG